MKMHTRISEMQEALAVARGDKPADLVVRGGATADVFSGRFEKNDIAIHGNKIVGSGAYTGNTIVDASGKYVLPGFIEGHIHLESTLLAPPETARCMVPRGTTCVVADPHEITNVLGSEGVEYMLESTRDLPMDFFFMLPSCVPATHLETAGDVFGVEDLLRLKDRPRILGLAEMMNFPGTVYGMEAVVEKLLAFGDGVRDGHAPLLRGAGLNAYLYAGPGSDHECTEIEEAAEKLSKGMMVMIRQGTQAADLETLLPLVTPLNCRRTMLVTDDRDPQELLELGHLDHNLRLAVAQGLDPIIAIRMVTLNPAEYFRLYGRGALAPGYTADVVIVDDLKTFRVDTVIQRGRVTVSNGMPIHDFPQPLAGKALRTMHLGELPSDAFRIPATGSSARVIRVMEGSILTRAESRSVKIQDGLAVSDPEQDVIKLVVLERHHASGRIGKGLVSGLGLKAGAIASTVAHDSHNIVAAGVEDEAVMRAVREVERMGGGLAAASADRVLATLPLPVAGLMSVEPVREVIGRKTRLREICADLGSGLKDPFMALSFLALPVIPELKLTDRGLVDVGKFDFVPLFL